MEVAKPRMVYIVDDDSAVRESLCVLLESHGFAVSGHESGNDFLDVYTDGAPCCVVLDYHMPGLNGLQVLERFRARGKAFPVMVITGRGDPALRERLLDAGASAVFDKPFDAEDLVHAIEGSFAR